MLASQFRLSIRAQTWQLPLLALTSVVLSVASGWTTWIGMQNFTGEKTLSLMITFGIQGVMLVLAWMVGSRMSEFLDENERPNSRKYATSERINKVTVFLKIAITSLLFLFFVALYFTYALDNESYIPSFLITALTPQAIFTAFLCATLVLAALRYNSAIANSVMSMLNFLARNIISTSMLAACAFASIFFSFDALFSTILPKEERARIAQLRVKSETSQIVSDISKATEASKEAAAQALFKTPQWAAFNRQLTDLVNLLQDAPKQARQAWNEAQERVSLATEDSSERNEKLKLDIARSTRTRTRTRTRDQLKKRIKETRQRVSRASQEIVRLDGALDSFKKEISEKKVELDAEERGLGASAVAGRGPQYRRIADELTRLIAKRENLELRLQSSADRQAELQRDLTRLEAQFATVLARHKSLTDRFTIISQTGSLDQPLQPQYVADTAQQKYALLQKARLDFTNQPDSNRLNALQTFCSKTVTFLEQVKDTQERLSCDVTDLRQTAAQVFSFNKNVAIINQRCLARNSGTEAIAIDGHVAFARNCLSWSGLKATDSRDIVARINRMERERDDKAHRFVVTTNAFFDGNKLALLAIGIAGAIDVLVLAAGFLGATAIRSPLAGSDLEFGQNARQRESIINAALMPDIADNARSALEVMMPAAHADHLQSDHRWTHELNLDSISSYTRAAVLRKLVNAAVAIGAARFEARTATATKILIKPQLVDYLAHISENASTDTNDADQILRKTLSTALGPETPLHSKTILGYFTPAIQDEGFSSEVDLASIAHTHKEIVRICLNVASAYELLKKTENGTQQKVLIRPALYLALLDLAHNAVMDIGPKSPTHSHTSGIVSANAIDGYFVSKPPAERKFKNSNVPAKSET